MPKETEHPLWDEEDINGPMDLKAYTQTWMPEHIPEPTDNPEMLQPDATPEAPRKFRISGSRGQERKTNDAKLLKAAMENGTPETILRPQQVKVAPDGSYRDQ